MQKSMLKKGTILVISILFIGAGIVPSSGKITTDKNILYVGGTGEGNYSSIQDAINDANSGDTIFVYNGTYYENVDITKDGIKLIGENNDNTIIDGFLHSASVIKIENHNDITISSFTIRNAKEGLDSLAGNGILLFAHSHNQQVVTVNNNIITNCMIYNNSGYGIYFASHDTHGFTLNTTISNCQIFNNNLSGISITAGAESYGESHVKYTKIFNSIIYHNGLIEAPLKVHYKSGIAIMPRGEINNNTITNCSIIDNVGCGLYIKKDYAYGTTSDDNKIYYNNFLNVTNNAFDDCNNIWDDGKYGNFWSDYIGIDVDGDGVGDSPYNISGGNNKDSYPLTHLFGPPYAEFTYDNETSVFDASLSGDYNGEIVNWSWSFGDGTTGDGEVVYHKYCVVGTYFVVLKVFDNDGLDDIFYKNIDVTIANTLPVLWIYGPNQGKPNIEYEYAFIMHDLDGDEIFIYIDWGGGIFEDWSGPYNYTNPKISSHIWETEGIYVIKAKVRDFCGESNWTEFEVEIPRNRMLVNLLFLWLFERFPILERLLLLIT